MKVLAPSIPTDLYRRAQHRLAQQPMADHSSPLPGEPQDELAHLKRELLIHQLALEIQREESHQLQTQLQTALDQHALTEEQLRTSTRLLEATQAIANIGSVELDISTRQLLWSEQTYRLHDTSPDKYQPQLDLHMEHYLPGSRERMAKALKTAVETGEVFDLEVEKYTFEGRKIDVRTTCTASYNERGELVRLTGIFHDISDRKQAERYQKHYSHILELLLEKAPLRQVLNAIARDLEDIHPDMFCSLWLLDEQSNQLQQGAAPSLPDFFVQSIDGLILGPQTLSCGSAIAQRARVIAANLQQHPSWASHRQQAASAHLGACWSEPIRSAEGKVLGTLAIYHRAPCEPQPQELALMEREAHLAALAMQHCRAEERLQLVAQVFSHAREAILITDAEGDIIDVNPTFCEITGFSRNQVLGKNPSLLQSGYHKAEFFTQMWQQLWHQGAWSGELWNRRYNGELFAASVTIGAVRNSQGEISHFVSLFNDITQLKENQRQLEYIAHYDSLTGLPNRVLLADRLRQAMSHSNRTGHSMAVLYLDLDGFKAINDQYGHDLGDQLLVAVATRMKAALRECDTLARIGGDEFVLVLSDQEQPKNLQHLLQRLLAAAAEPVHLDNLLLRVSASIGVTCYPQDKVDGEQLLRHADQAMYQAKQQGKNAFYFFDVESDLAERQQYESTERLRQALNNREFELYYQPKVNMASGELVGLEALLRWQHPERGLLGPDEFLPLLENHPFSLEVGEWVLAQALTQLEAWQQQGHPLNLSINVSALQLQHPPFAHYLATQLQAHPGVAPEQLELEIVETSALADVSEVAQIMRACMALGVRFAMDDFGTGYASLNYLRRLPAEILKIDQSFVRDMFANPDDLAIIEGVIGLAHTFKRQVIAEGVETIEQGEKLIALGCPLGQGYAIAHPMPASELPAWRQQWQPHPSWRQVGETQQ